MLYDCNKFLLLSDSVCPTPRRNVKSYEQKSNLSQLAVASSSTILCPSWHRSTSRITTAPCGTDSGTQCPNAVGVRTIRHLGAIESSRREQTVAFGKLPNATGWQPVAPLAIADRKSRIENQRPGWRNWQTRQTWDCEIIDFKTSLSVSKRNRLRAENAFLGVNPRIHHR